MREARYSHTAALLPTGAVLIAGGTGGADGAPLASAEIYSPATNSFATTGKLAEARFKLPESTALVDGRVLIVGGGATAELYDRYTGTFRTVNGSLDTARYYPAILRLMDGSTRIFGGYDSKGISTAKTWIYRP